MAFTRTRAAKLLTASEMTLFTESLARETRDLTPARLTAKVRRSRNLRDKYRDLYKRQVREGRQRARSASARPANERTAKKAQLFDEVLKRFEKHAARRPAKRETRRIPARSTRRLVEAKRGAQARQRAARRTPVSPKAPAHLPSSGSRVGRRHAQVMSDESRFDLAGAPRIQGHVKASGQRNQAKRDRR